MAEYHSDLPQQAQSLVQLPAEDLKLLAQRALDDLFVFAKFVMAYSDMTRKCHGPVCVFIDKNPSRIKEILMPRDHFKSSLITIAGNLKKATANPNERILIAGENSTNAERFLRSIRQHCESNKIYRTLYSHVLPKDVRKVRWNDSELEFKREWMGPEPTFDTLGITGAWTSRHYTHLTFDDLISEEATKSEKVMKDTIDRAKKYHALWVKPMQDTLWLVGTRWAFHDIYSFFEQKLRGRMARLVRAVYELNAEGQPEIIFPELLDWDTIAELRETQGEYAFSCLYLNNPRNEEVQDFNVKDLRWWQWANDQQTEIILFDQAGQETHRWHVSQLDITTTVDLAAAETNSSDRNAVTTVGLTPLNQWICLDAWAKRCNPLQLIEYLLYIQRRFEPRVVGIEEVAYQKAFKWFLQYFGSANDIYLNIKPIRAIKQKEVRIRGLQPIAATGRLFLNPLQHALRTELSQFPLGEHDDLPDSLSGHLQLVSLVASEHKNREYIRREQQVLHEIALNNRLLSGVSVQRAEALAEADVEDVYQPAPLVQDWSF